MQSSGESVSLRILTGDLRPGSQTAGLRDPITLASFIVYKGLGVDDPSQRLILLRNTSNSCAERNKRKTVSLH